MTDTRESLGLDWRFSASDSVIMDSANRLMLDVSGLTHEEAAFIVTACNAHHDLVERVAELEAALSAVAKEHADYVAAAERGDCLDESYSYHVGAAVREHLLPALLKAKGGAL